MSDDLEEFFEFIEFLEEHRERMPKRYVRDMENPLEVCSAQEFQVRYRFRKETVVETVLPLVMEGLQKPDNRGLPISPVMQLLICLRFYATSNFQVVAGDFQGISQPTISGIIKRVSILIAERLSEFITFPRTQQEFRANFGKFYEVANMPKVVGCIGCTHIKIANPGGDTGEAFRNNEGFFSLKVQVVSGPKGEICDIVVRHPGSANERLIFDRSGLRVRLERGDIPGLLLGDNAYACKHYLLTPVLQPDNEPDLRYNAAHIKTRNVVERLFEAWKRKFPCLERGLQTKLETSVAVICATAVLHNIALQEESVNPEEEVGRNAQEAAGGLDFRRQFIQNHFTN